MTRRVQDFQTIRSEGGLLPSDLLRRVITPTEKLDGTGPQDYGLPAGERLNEVITQSWNRLRRHWAEFRAAAAGLPESEAGTGLTNDKWSLPLLRELGFGPLPTSAGPEVGGRTYAISRFLGPVPVHLVGCGLSLDRRKAGTAGASAASPHGLVQEFLNRSSAHLWAIVSNGLILRVLRDNQALSRQSYLEFDLQAMLDGEVYSDFVLLWLMSHATRLAPRESDRPESCWLEEWTRVAVEQGTRALGDLRTGVGAALQVLGQGFTSQPKNTALRESLRSGQLSAADLHGQLLRVVYRLIFLFVAEDRSIDGRPLLHPPDDSKNARVARERYAAHYSTARLREMAGKIKGSRHGDLWRQLQSLVGALSGEASFAAVRDHLALPALGSFLWSQGSTSDLNGAELSNHDLLEAVRNLGFTRQGKVLRPVNYKNLGAEELGGVYEGLLALTPQISADGSHFTFAEFAGNERKTSGSYYTPDSLVQCLLDSALDPVVEGAINGKTGAEAEKALLALKVCDPAVGSGHFLVGAAHRMARHLARVRSLAQGESEPSPLLYQRALRDVIGRCLYGVDINPMAAELCRVSLWLEALEPGKPLSFLDHHIRVGNSLLGATPQLIAAGLPDDAFEPIEGDDKKACTILRKRNKAERRGVGPLFAAQDAESQSRLLRAASELEGLPDNRAEEIRAKELAFRRQEETEEYQQKKGLADAWCAAFLARKHFSEPGRESSVTGITQGHLNGLVAGQPLPPAIATQTTTVTARYLLFHWHLVFPEVFAKGGFDCVLGNPPWENLQADAQEFFATSASLIANAVNMAERNRIVDDLKSTHPELYAAWVAFQHDGEATRHFLRSSQRYPLTTFGRLNTYGLFAELGNNLLCSGGRCGIVLPVGIATDAFNQFFFSDLVRRGRLVSLYGFENEEFVFPQVHHSFKFALLTVGSDGVCEAPELAFYLRSVAGLTNPELRYRLARSDFELINPNTVTCPVFRSRSDAAITAYIYRHWPVVRREEPYLNPWGVSCQLMFMMNTVSELTLTREELGEAEPHDRFGEDRGPEAFLPLLEGKMFHQFDHRFGTYEGQTEAQARQGKLPEVSPEGHRDPLTRTLPRYWLPRAEVQEALGDWSAARWLVSWRDVTSSVVLRTVIVTVLPVAAANDSAPLVHLPDRSAREVCAFVACLNAFMLDFVARQKLGGNHLRFFSFYQLPVVTPQALAGGPCGWALGASAAEWIFPRALELIYTAWDLESFASDCGVNAPPYIWDERRRFLLRCELDAAFFHLYLKTMDGGAWRPAEGEAAEALVQLQEEFETPRDAVAYILDTFPIVRRRDEEAYDGDFRTKRVILEMYDAMQESIRTGQPYQTRLDPPPADPRCCHPDRPIATTA